MNRVPAEALKEKARRMGQIKEMSARSVVGAMKQSLEAVRSQAELENEGSEHERYHPGK